MPGGLAPRCRALLFAVLVCAAGAVIPGSARAQSPTEPIRLPAGRRRQMPLTIENKCPRAESFQVSTEGLPAGLVRPSGPIEIPASSSRDYPLLLDATGVPPGPARGQIVVTCTSCGRECVQDRRVFDVQFLIEGPDLSQPRQEGPPPGTPPTENPPPTAPPSAPPSSPPPTTSKAPCPCEEACRAAVSAEVAAKAALDEYDRLSSLADTLRKTISTLTLSSQQDQDLAAHYQSMGGYDAEVTRLRSEAADLQKQIGDLQAQLADLKARLAAAATDADTKARAAAAARRTCDDCVASHPECPRSPWQAAGFTTEAPPDPEAPYLHDNPNPPVAPPGSPGGGPDSHRSLREDDCPQRNRGCVALVVDLMRYESLYLDYPDLKVDVAGKLSAAGCVVDHEEPDFRRYPDPIKIEMAAGGHTWTMTIEPPAEAYTWVGEHNAVESRLLNAAIAQHREAVGKGVDIAIEVLEAHGAGAWDGMNEYRCGSVGTGYFTGYPLYRADFHEGNYRAANKNVCKWFTADFSCFGGLTPKVVDELDNLTTSSCKAASTINCGDHAGWEADGSMASATAVQTCSFYTAEQLQKQLLKALDAQMARRAAHPGADFTGLIDDLGQVERAGTSLYSDRGYAKDHPPRHARAGYTTRSAPAPCSGGKCE